MRPCGPLKVPGAAQPNGRRVVGRIAHISYFNQWNYAWVGFSAETQPFVGLFAHSGGLWERRGHVRPEIIEDDHRGHLLRLPLKQGRRLYGLVFCTREESALASTAERNLLNRRKIQLSDLPLGKVHAWELNPPLEPCRFNLLRTDDVAGFRRRLAADAQVTAALDAFHQLGRCGHGAELAAAFWKADSARVAELAEEVVRRAEVSLAHAAEGGYECVIIFDGRAAKSLAYDVDLLWGEGVMHEDQYRRARKALLLLAYIFADPDYWRGGDFWPLTEPDEGIAEALKDDMGDCPVPPNFASEFFSTTGVVAELFPNHPLSPDWRDWSIEQTEAFLDTFFAPDGTYHESVNYHTHAVSELVCHFFPLWWKGHRDFFQNPRVKGSFRHFALIQMPPLVEGVARPAAPAAKMGYRVATYAAWDLAERALLPNNGNSGDEGLAQEPRGETTVAAAVYAKSDPDLAGHLMHLWATSGKALQDQEHPVLTLTTLDPQIRPLAPSWVSCQRLGLGIVSKARRRDGLPVWSLYRAGAATHHMDFDQGHLHLTAGNRELLGDYGYHAHDSDGTALPAAATWLHNTLTYGRRRELSSGYTGLERAPEPITVHLGGDFDWCVHRIINGNYRDLTNVGYRTMIPAAGTVHVRHYLFVKPDYFVLWDTFEEADQPATFWLHPRHPVTQKDSRSFFAGPEGGEGIGLQVRFVLPASFKVVENARRGPLWSLGVQGEAGGPFLAILAPQPQFSPILATLHPTRWLLRVETDDGLNDTLILPPPGSAGELPQVKRGV